MMKDQTIGLSGELTLEDLIEYAEERGFPTRNVIVRVAVSGDSIDGPCPDVRDFNDMFIHETAPGIRIKGERKLYIDLGVDV